MTVDIDMRAEIMSAPEMAPRSVLVLPWGDGVGEVGRNEIAGPHSIDVAPDGTVYVVDVLNGRIERFDGEVWSVFVDYGTDASRQPFGVAALDSGAVAVQVRGLSGNNTTATIEMFDPSGRMVGSTLAPVITNHPFGGGTNVWTAYTVGAAPTVWLQLSNGMDLVDFDDDLLTQLNAEWERTQINSDLSASMTAALTAGYVHQRVDGDMTLTITNEFIDRDTFPHYQVSASRGVDALRVSISNWVDVAPSQWDISPDGVMFVAVREGREVVAVLCDYAGACTSLRTPREQWSEVNTWDWARLSGRDLYLLQTGPNGARIEIYDM